MMLDTENKMCYELNFESINRSQNLRVYRILSGYFDKNKLKIKQVRWIIKFLKTKF